MIPSQVHWANAMTKSSQTLTLPPSVFKEKKAKIFYEHGKDALGLALSVANLQEEKALQKAEKHHRPQAGKPRSERKDRASDKGKRLDETKIMIAKRRTEARKEKARSRKESKNRLQQRDNSKINAPEGATATAPRKRVSFA